MSRILTAIFIIIIVVTCGVLSELYVQDAFNSLNEHLVEIENLIPTENTDILSSKMDDLLVWWRNKRNHLELLCPHNDIRDMVTSLAELQGLIQVGKFQDALVKVNVIKEDSFNKLNILSFKPKNIF